MNNQTNWINQKATVSTEAEFKSNIIKDNLNSFIESPTDDIDTTGYYKWEQTGNRLPTINPNIEWNGTEWIEK